MSSGSAELSTTAYPDPVAAVTEYPDVDVTAETTHGITMSAVPGFVVTASDSMTAAGFEVDAFLEVVGPMVRDALIEVFQRVLGQLEDAPSDEERVNRLRMLWDMSLAQRAEQLLGTPEFPEHLAETVLREASAGGVPELHDEQQARNWIAFIVWLILAVFAGIWAGYWAAHSTIDGLAVLVGVALALWDRYEKFT